MDPLKAFPASRRDVLIAAGAAAVTLGAPSSLFGATQKHTNHSKGNSTMSTVKTKDGTNIYFKDWGKGKPVVFCHGWPLTADAWDSQMLFLSEHGYRVIAHDRRGHGRSDQTPTGNDMDTYADDLETLLKSLDVKDAVIVGHSTGGGEVARYIGKHGKHRVSKAVLISSIPPHLVKTETNPDGAPMQAFDGLRAGYAANRAQFLEDFAMPFFGYNREGAKVSQGTINSFWMQSMLGGVKPQYDCIKALSETDFTDDLKKMTMPTLLIQGDDDQVAPIQITSMKSVKILPNANLKVYPGAPHGLCVTHAEKVNADLLEFIKS
jgi:non-heme chloroperoxidase